MIGLLASSLVTSNEALEEENEREKPILTRHKSYTDSIDKI